MTLPRRQFLHLVAGAAVLPAVSRIASAQAYPARTVRLVVPFGSGGAPDIVARLVGQWLSEQLGQPFVVENRPGGSGNVATEAVAKSPPDGYTLLVIAPSHAINATLYDKLNFVFLRDIAPVVAMVRFPNVLVVNPSVPANTIPELIAYAKANPGKLNMASTGVGGNPHVAGELFQIMTGVNFVHVPYRSPASVLTDLLSGQVQLYFASTASATEYVRSGGVRALGVTSATRWEGLPDIPAIAEFAPGYEATAWFGMGAPAHTPADIIDKLNKEIIAALAEPKIKARLASLGGAVLGGSPADFGKLCADETEKWARVVKSAGIRPE